MTEITDVTSHAIQRCQTYSRTGMLSRQSWKQPKLKPTASRPAFLTKLMLVTQTSAVNRHTASHSQAARQLDSRLREKQFDLIWFTLLGYLRINFFDSLIQYVACSSIVKTTVECYYLLLYDDDNSFCLMSYSHYCITLYIHNNNISIVLLQRQ